jgi:hypothetical protein
VIPALFFGYPESSPSPRIIAGPGRMKVCGAGFKFFLAPPNVVFLYGVNRSLVVRAVAVLFRPPIT